MGTPDIWNPLPGFTDVRSDGQLSDVQTIDHFYSDVKAGNLPAVSWIAPNGVVSEHPPALVSTGQAYVTTLIDAIMRSPEWSSTAIFLISPYARQGFIDHQTLSHDAYVKFIEDVFLGGARLDPKTDGRPDSRPDVRENDPALGNLMADFDFNQQPRPPLVLYPHPSPGPASSI